MKKRNVHRARAYAAHIHKKAYDTLAARAASGELFTLEDIAADVKAHAVFVQPALTSLMRRGIVRHVDTVEQTVDAHAPFTRHVRRFQGTVDVPTN